LEYLSHAFYPAGVPPRVYRLPCVPRILELAHVPCFSRSKSAQDSTPQTRVPGLSGRRRNV
jgi:hypothetical protein